ncbi:MAG: hypothetical protein Q8J64_00685 [Thermodesulfovibrionales bacterium]|nr:hypothetical protein [Thermodesulfovibrionales bacterium]
MKKYLAIVLSAVFVLGLAATAFAVMAEIPAETQAAVAKGTTQVTLGGEARVRAISKDDYDFNGTTDDSTAYYDQRVRLMLDAKTADGVEVKTRLTISEGQWNGATQTGGNPSTDYAYISFPVQKFRFDVGRQMADFGNKFMVWQAPKDRLKVTTKIGDSLVGFFTDKNTETGVLDNDSDSYALLAKGKAGELEVGGMLIYQTNKATDKNGQTLDLYTKGSVAGLNLDAELTYKGGEINEKINTKGDKVDPLGFYAHVAKPMGPLTVGALLGYAKNFTADNDFAPTLFFGTSQITAMADFGGGGSDTTTAIGAGASYKVTEAITGSGKLVYAMFDIAAAGVKDPTLIEIDLGMKYQLAKSLSYNLDFGYGIPSDATTTDDAAVVLAHRIEITF